MEIRCTRSSRSLFEAELLDAGMEIHSFEMHLFRPGIEWRGTTGNCRLRLTVVYLKFGSHAPLSSASASDVSSGEDSD
jgi:hypothetical protein